MTGVRVVKTTKEQVHTWLDEETQKLYGMSADDYLALYESGTEPDDWEGDNARLWASVLSPV